MRTDDLLALLAALAGGAALGVFFFLGLKWTVVRALASPRPVAWQLSSVLVRTAVTVGGIYLLGQGDARRMIAALAGWTVARFVVVRAVARPSRKQVADAAQP